MSILLQQLWKILCFISLQGVYMHLNVHVYGYISSISSKSDKSMWVLYQHGTLEEATYLYDIATTKRATVTTTTFLFTSLDKDTGTLPKKKYIYIYI